jgi:hypothetical protein
MLHQEITMDTDADLLDWLLADVTDGYGDPQLAAA